MLEIRTYSLKEIAAELEMKEDRQAIKRKLERKGIEYDIEGRKPNITFTIKNIPSPFKLFCIKELNFAPNCDFQKIRNLFYYCFNDEEFFVMPQEFKERRLDEANKHISSQTISNYLQKLIDANYYSKSTDEFVYYIANKNNRRYTTKEEYLEAWHIYWKLKEEVDVYCAIAEVKKRFGGFPRKHYMLEPNGIEMKNISTLIELTNQSFDEEYNREF